MQDYYYVVLIDGKQLIEQKIWNINSAKATAKIYRDQNYDFTNKQYPKVEVVKMPDNKVVYCI
jgi:hypothetical protein